MEDNKENPEVVDSIKDKEIQVDSSENSQTDESAVQGDSSSVPEADGLKNEVSPEMNTEPELVNEAAVSSQASSPSVSDEAQPTAEVFGMDANDLRGMLIKMLLASLAVSAAVAVISILVGSWTDVTSRSVGTIAVAMLHMLIMFSAVSMATRKQPEAFRASSNMMANAVMTITLLSFFTAVMHIWEVIGGDIAGKLYVTYVVLLIGLSHARILMDVQAVYGKVKPYVYANYGFIALVSLLILGLVYIQDSVLVSNLLSGFYGRLLAASAVVDVTLSMTIAVLQKLHFQKHPELYKGDQTSGSSVLRIVTIILLTPVILFFVIGFFMLSIFF